MQPIIKKICLKKLLKIYNKSSILNIKKAPTPKWMPTEFGYFALLRAAYPIGATTG